MLAACVVALGFTPTSRRAVIAGGAAALFAGPPSARPAHAFDVQAAMDAATAGAACPTQSCVESAVDVRTHKSIAHTPIPIAT